MDERTRRQVYLEQLLTHGPYDTRAMWFEVSRPIALLSVAVLTPTVAQIDPASPAVRLRAVRRWVNRLAQLLQLASGERAGDDWYRAGDMLCERCGESYLRHAGDAFDPWLTVLCSGKRVKL